MIAEASSDPALNYILQISISVERDVIIRAPPHRLLPRRGEARFAVRMQSILGMSLMQIESQ